MPSPRILYLSPEHPDPEGNGGEVRLFKILSALGQRGREVTVVAPATARKIARGCTLAADGIDLRPVRRPGSPGREAVEAVLGHPRLAVSLATHSWLAWQAEVYLREMQPVLTDVLRRRWDAVVIEHDWAIGWSRILPDDMPVGVMFHNVTDQLLARQVATQGRSLVALRARRDVHLARRETNRHAPRLSRAFACSKDDAATIERRWALRTDVIPNGTDVARLARVGHGDEVPGRIVFTGTMSYPPNAQAAAWFVHEVLPRIRRVRPDATVRIIGGAPGPNTLKLADEPGVEVAGRVPSLDPYLAEASVAVAPILAGGGTKLKVLEALAAGRPLVATPVGAEGIAVDHMEHLRIAVDPDAFGREVIALLSDPREARLMAERGRRRVAERYDWAVVGRQMDEALTDWLGA